MAKLQEERKIDGRNPECTLCPLHKTSCAADKTLVCLWGRGVTETDIVFVGEAPGMEEIAYSKPFVGESGRFLSDYLVKAGLQESKVWITNSVKCRPPRNRTPKPAELKACSGYLDYELDTIKPKVIGLLGAVALQRVLGAKGITKLRGKPVWSNRYNCWCVPMYHPSFIKRNGSPLELTEAFIKDLQLIKKIVETGETGQLGTKFQVVDTMEKFIEFEKLLDRQSVAAFDTETKGTFLDGKVIMMQFSWKPGEAWVLPFYKTHPDVKCLTCNGSKKVREGRKKVTCAECNGRGGFETPLVPVWGEADAGRIWQSMTAYLENPQKKKVGQNIKYDYKFLRQFGITLQGVCFDTMLAHYLLDENDKGGHGLDALAIRFTDMGDYTIEFYEALGVKSSEVGQDTYSTAPFEALRKYAAKDADATFRLFCVFFKRIKEQKLLPLLTKIMIPLSFELAEMERTGIEVDVDYYKKLATEYESKLSDIETALNEFPAAKVLEKRQGKPVNFNSSDQLRVLFYDILELPVLKKTKTKNKKTRSEPKPSTDREVLEKLADKHDIPRLMQEHRKLTKFLSTYIKPMAEYVDIDGRVHTSYTQHITTTGRLSSHDPNLQNIPKREPEKAKQVRNGIIATKRYRFGEWDFGQIEFRLLANECGDEVMIADIEDSALDIHKKIASLGFGIKYEEVTKELREKAKTIVYSVVYGKSEDNLAKETELTVEQVKAVFGAIFGRYKRLKAWMDKQVNCAKSGQDVVNWVGRRRRLQRAFKKAFAVQNPRAREMMVAEAARQAVNSPIQGGASDILCIATIRVCRMLRERGFKSRPVLTIHDALVLEIHDEELDTVPKLVKTEMEKPIQGIRVKMSVDGAIGSRLGEMEKLEIT